MKPLKILFADDDLKYSMLLKRFLEKEGYEVTYAGNGLIALDQFPLVKPDLVLLDINMPGLNGFEVAKRIRTIQSLSVGAGVVCPETQSKLFSGERTSPLRTKRQHYPRFDNLFLLYRVTYPFLSLAGRGIFVQRVTTWRMEYGKN